MEIAVRDGKLVFMNRRSDGVPVAPGARDRFDGTGAAAGTQAVFERDKNGQVIALYLGNGRTRDVRFARVR